MNSVFTGLLLLALLVSVGLNIQQSGVLRGFVMFEQAEIPDIEPPDTGDLEEGTGCHGTGVPGALACGGDCDDPTKTCMENADGTACECL